MVICPDCGKEVPKEKFCKNCGAFIKNVEEVKVIEEDVSPVIPEASEEKDIGEVKVIEDDVSPVIPVIGEENNIEEVEVIEEDETPEIPETSGETSLHVSVESNKVNFCHNCGAKITGNFKFCPECGQDLNSNVSKSTKTVASSGEKNILLAVILSVVLPGLGQIYLGLDNKGAKFLIAYVVSAILILVLIGFLLCAIIWIWALIDTIISTNSINRGEEVIDKLF